MLSHRFQAIFIHVPKTAGQSIERVFLKQHGLSWGTRSELLLRGNDDSALGPQRLAHLYAREYVACGHVGATQFARYFKFAVVRNPYERTLSEFRYRFANEGRSFTSFLQHIPEDEFTDRARHMAPQVKFVCDEAGQILVDRVLRYETLEQDIGSVFARIFGAILRLPHANRSDGSIAATDLGAPERELIYRRFEADFDLFGYPRN